MKKVRFLSPVKKHRINGMNESECQSPRPYVEMKVKTMPPIAFPDIPYRRVVPFSNDPVQRFEYGNTSPYPIMSKTCLLNTLKLDKTCSPSNELDLSILDCTYNEPRNTLPRPNNIQCYEMNTLSKSLEKTPITDNSSRILGSVENKSTPSSRNVLTKKDDFFLRKENLNDFNQVQSQLKILRLDKENNPLLRKTEIMNIGIPSSELVPSANKQDMNSPMIVNQDCRCHHCEHVLKTKHNMQQTPIKMLREQRTPLNSYKVCHCIPTLTRSCTHCPCKMPPVTHFMPICDCNKPSTVPTLQNAVDKKNWTLEKFEKNKQTDCLDVERQKNINKETCEPTVADLFKIIKLQNEQLQLLQEKVDKFISTSKINDAQKSQPIQNYFTEHLEVKSVETDEKISIGVMTSFEMFRTSTIINKEVVKQSEAQIQCNRSQISIKEVISKAHPVNSNFLDGIAPVASQPQTRIQEQELTRNMDNVDKTFNEVSLYNVQVDNATTPMMSPEQSLYLDIRDYSDSEASSDDRSNVGWTYYNKVMSHVNGILQESDMPSSASALYRNGKQKYLQMNVDRTNVSTAKRVTFGDEQALRNQMQPATDTSLKMNQLAAKYLKNGPLTSKTLSPKPIDMSIATRNYMETHRLLHGNLQKNQAEIEIPKFLDITALKQQPKLL